MTEKIKVLIVDDSILIRKILSRLISSQADMEVIAEAVDPIEARTHLSKNPDVLTLDVEMPRMDGLTFLQRLMRLRPMPVVMVSTLTEKSAAITFKALELGAFDFVTKPKLVPGSSELSNGAEILNKIREAYKSKDFYQRMAPKLEPENPSAKSLHILAGAGSNTIYKDLLQGLNAQSPIVTILHKMPEGFSDPFAQRLRQQSPIPVHVTTTGQVLQPGNVYVIPFEKHPQLQLRQKELVLDLQDHPAHVGSWMASIGAAAGKYASAVVLSGGVLDDITGFKSSFTQGVQIYSQDIPSCMEPSLIEALKAENCISSTLTPAELGETITAMTGRI